VVPVPAIAFFESARVAGCEARWLGGLPEDPWIREAAAIAECYLLENAILAGWPRMPGGEMDAETSCRYLLVAGWIGPDRAPQVALPPSDPDGAYGRLQEALVAVRTGTAVELPTGCRPFDQRRGVRSHIAT